MKQEAKRLLAVNVLYACIPLLLMLLPMVMEKIHVQMEAYGAAYSAYLVLTELCVIVLPALIWLLTPHGRECAKDFWRDKPTAAILLVIPLSVCAYFAVNSLTIMWFILLNQFGITQMPQTVPSPQNIAQLMTGVAVIAVVPALCEEFFFRGVLQPALHRQMKPWVAIVLGGCLFGLAHGQIIALPGHVVLGMMLCFVAYWTRSVWYTMLWHVMQNGIAVVITYMENFMQSGVDAEASLAMLTEQPVMMLLSSAMLLGFFGVAAVGFLVLLLIATRKHHKENKPQRAEEKAPWWAYAPLIAALGCIVYLYISGTIPLMGGGA